MEKIMLEHWYQIVLIISIVVGAVLLALYKIGWLRISKDSDWDGVERRECAQHGSLNQKVCGLYTKLEDIDKKLDAVAEKLQYVLGRLSIDGL